MRETASQYTRRLLGYTGKADPLDLQRTAPKRLAALLDGRSKRELTRRPSAEGWSVAEIAAHMADAEVAVAWRLRQILSTDGVPIQAYDQDAWAATFDYAHRDPRQSLELFRVLRENNVALLRSVARKLWKNHGVHQERGNESITRVVRMVAGHDLNHLKQIERILQAAKTTA